MRAAGAQGFEYPSARCPNGGVNVALFTPDGLTRTKPTAHQNALCETIAEQVTYSLDNRLYVYELELFYGDGKLPLPALKTAEPHLDKS